MEMRELRENGTPAEIAQMIDHILESVLALQARLGNSNRDSNSLGGATLVLTTRDYSLLPAA